MTIRRELGWCQPKRGRNFRKFFAFVSGDPPYLFASRKMDVIVNRGVAAISTSQPFASRICTLEGPP